MARVHACLNTCVVKFAPNSTGDDDGSANDVPDLLQFLNEERIDQASPTPTRALDFEP